MLEAVCLDFRIAPARKRSSPPTVTETLKNSQNKKEKTESPIVINWLMTVPQKLKRICSAPARKRSSPPTVTETLKNSQNKKEKTESPIVINWLMTVPQKLKRICSSMAWERLPPRWQT